MAFAKHEMIYLESMQAKQAQGKFYGWWVAAASFFTFGVAVGVPYYNISFFYDYFQHEFGWQLSEITFGFPLAALLTIWVGPLVIHRFSPRKLILVGTLLTALAFLGFSRMTGDLKMYYFFWFLYTVGYIFSGPIPHQLLVSHWFRKKRGMAMGIVYVGVGLLGSAFSFFVKPITEQFGFRPALFIMGALALLAWPLAIFLIRDKPSDKGQYPDGAAEPPAETKQAPHSFAYLLKSWPFWLLLIGSCCSIGSIGAINMHMKLVFRESGFTDQATLNSVWRYASIVILWSSILGRLSIGYLADVFSKKRVMTATYFIVAATIPLLLMVKPPQDPLMFALIFGFAMGADYMLIPLMVAEQFGVNSLARAMSIILPTDTIGQTFFPFVVSMLREHFGSYAVPMSIVFAVAMIGAVAIAVLPRQKSTNETLSLQDAERAATKL